MAIKIDFSKGAALHRLYGCTVFRHEAKRSKKPPHWVAAICQHARCGSRI